MNALAALARLREARGVPPVASSSPLPVLSSPEPAPRKLDAMAALAQRSSSTKEFITESRRIAALPRWDYDEVIARCQPGGEYDYTERFRAKGGTMTLKPIQNLALHWIEEKKGLVGPLAVGAGKTLLSLLAAPVMGAKRPILLIPPALQIPLRMEMERLSAHFVLPKNLYIIPYSQLSVARSTALLEDIKPDLIIADEAHNLRSADAARTKRVLRYFDNFPTTRLIALSGTLTAKSLKDYNHLCRLALGSGSPVPLAEADLVAWANVLDSDGEPTDRDWSVFAAFSDVRHVPLSGIDRERGVISPRQDAAREAFRDRFNATPGVVATREASVSCSLNFYRRPVTTPDEVVIALDELQRTWTRPDGEEMDSALSLWRLGMQISQGFYLRWVWPDGIPDKEWMEARAAWHREVRAVLSRNMTGMDSPLLVWNAVERGALDYPSISWAFRKWKEQKHKPPPPTETVWISDYMVRDTLAWLKAHPKGLVWHNDLATETALRAAGVPTFGAGEVPVLDGSVGGMALSIRVHGTGLDRLQYHHHENLVLSFPSSGKTCEQMIGRTHRQAQEADEVGVWYYAHTVAAQQAVATARNRARYIEQTQGSPQKLSYGAWA
jgi:hypothetical protein